MLASDGKCWQRMANVDHARWQSWSAFSWCCQWYTSYEYMISNEKTCPASWSIKIKLLETDLLGLVVHGLTGTASICSLQCWCRCFGTGTLEPGPVSLCGVWEQRSRLAMQCWPWLATSGDAAVVLDASGCFWMLDISGPCKFHHFPKRSHWSSAEPQDIAAPRRSAPWSLREPELSYGREIQASACRDQELRNSTVMWVPVYHKSTPGPLDEAGAKCGFPGELKKLIGLSRSGSEQNFQVTLALGLESVCSVPQKKTKK